MPTIVSGTVSTVAELEQDEAWLREWFRERPARLGLGELEVADDQADDMRTFAATDEDHYFSVDVRLGELEASHGFELLDSWARNRVRHPDRSHVAVLVTEAVGERYRPTLETLSEHLPLVVVQLQVWRGEQEAIVVPYVALASKDVDLGATPAARAGAVVEAATVKADATDEDADAATDDEAAPTGEATTVETEADAGDDDEEAATVDKDDTGVGNPWGLPRADTAPGDPDAGNANGHRLLSKIGG